MSRVILHFSVQLPPSQPQHHFVLQLRDEDLKTMKNSERGGTWHLWSDQQQGFLHLFPLSITSSTEFQLTTAS